MKLIMSPGRPIRDGSEELQVHSDISWPRSDRGKPGTPSAVQLSRNQSITQSLNQSLKQSIKSPYW